MAGRRQRIPWRALAEGGDAPHGAQRGAPSRGRGVQRAVDIHDEQGRRQGTQGRPQRVGGSRVIRCDDQRRCVVGQARRRRIGPDRRQGRGASENGGVGGAVATSTPPHHGDGRGPPQRSERQSEAAAPTNARGVGRILGQVAHLPEGPGQARTQVVPRPSQGRQHAYPGQIRGDSQCTQASKARPEVRPTQRHCRFRKAVHTGRLAGRARRGIALRWKSRRSGASPSVGDRSADEGFLD
jgi:hypothetical protein